MSAACSLCVSRFNNLSSQLEDFVKYMLAECKSFFVELQRRISSLYPLMECPKCTNYGESLNGWTHCRTTADRIEKEVCSLIAELVDQYSGLDCGNTDKNIESPSTVNEAGLDVKDEITVSSDCAVVAKNVVARKCLTTTTPKNSSIHIMTSTTSKPQIETPMYKCEPSSTSWKCPTTTQENITTESHHSNDTDITITRNSYICDICPKSFASQSSCSIHRRTHTGERFFYCDICSISLTTKDSLVAHMRTHTNERPFMCHECCKTFRQGSAFRRHRLTHTGHRPFKCNLCVKAFPTKRQLSRHVLSHTGERPHLCPICKRGYTQRFECKKHIRNVHKDVDVDIVFPKLRRGKSIICDD